MTSKLSPLQSANLPLPARGGSSRWQLGRLEFVLEYGRGGHSLLCLDGQQARSWSLGLRNDGELWLHCRVPRWPLRVALQDTMVLVPRSRVRGFVMVPLVPTLCWRPQGGDEMVIAELLPPMLSAEWSERDGSCVQRCTSPLFQRLPPADDEPRAVVPLTVRNDSARMQSPETLPVTLQDRELVACRGHLVASPRRLAIDGDGAFHVQLRARRAEQSL